MSPKFSIIIPVYNVAPYLRECLDSVVAQTFTDWEAICVDDGSTDGSGAILDEYAAKDDRIRVIHQKNAGVSVARNMALDIVNGEWIGFVDADDVILSDWLAVIDSVLSDFPTTDWVRLSGIRWDGAAWPCVKCNESVEHHLNDVLPWGWNLLCDSGALWKSVYRREILQGKQLVEGLSVSEDTLFSIEVLKSVRSACYIPYAGYLYRRREGSAVLSNMRAQDILVFLCRFIELAEYYQRALPNHLEVVSRAVMVRIRLCLNRFIGRAVDKKSPDVVQFSEFLRRLWRAGLLRLSDLSIKWRVRVLFLMMCRNKVIVKLLWIVSHRFFGVGAWGV